MAMTNFIREQRGISSAEYALLIVAILLVAAAGYRALGKGIGASTDKGTIVLEGGNATASGSASGNGQVVPVEPSPGGSPPPVPVTPPGQGQYYKNDTPIDIPPEQAEDRRPANHNWLWKYVGRPLAGPFSGENRAGVELEAVVPVLRYVKHYDHAADLLSHWLYDDGSAYQINPQDMMHDLPAFNDAVQSQIKTANGGAFDTGWRSDSVANHISGDPHVLDWYYALNGYQYRVRGTPVEVDGVQYQKVTVDVFKRYNWGNPTGGGHRNDLKALGGLIDINQNDAAQLNADG
ncbi:MAG TPA: hypothetical protein VNO21_18985, partial [Polyangiaceae bacterium]|nr:hypothetical protein [Polyangiaceae bacterium]